MGQAGRTILCREWSVGTGFLFRSQVLKAAPTLKPSPMNPPSPTLPADRPYHPRALQSCCSPMIWIVKLTVVKLACHMGLGSMVGSHVILEHSGSFTFVAHRPCQANRTSWKPWALVPPLAQRPQLLRSRCSRLVHFAAFRLVSGQTNEPLGLEGFMKGSPMTCRCFGGLRR